MRKTIASVLFDGIILGAWIGVLVSGIRPFDVTSYCITGIVVTSAVVGFFSAISDWKLSLSKASNDRQ